VSASLDVLSIRDLEVRCIVGVYPKERDIPQPLIVDVDLWLDTRSAARSESLAATVDYGRVAGELRFLLESCRFRLVETAAEALSRWLLAPSTDDRPRPKVERARVKLTKPEALGGGAKAVLEIVREAREVKLEQETKPFGVVDIIHVGRDCGVYRLRVAPGRSIPTHVHRVMDEHELILGDGLLLQKKPVAPATAFHWPKELPHRYDNPTHVEQSILCVDRPPFLPADEIEVEEPATGFTLPPPSSYAPAAALDGP
jgi:dihydroneopterin aldolase